MQARKQRPQSAPHNHYAHVKGMEGYSTFFREVTEPQIRAIVEALKKQDEFDNKIFIVVADHGHTAQPTDLYYVDPVDGSTKPAEMSCSLKVDGFDKSNVQEAEKANNNLHIWELGELLKVVGNIRDSAASNKYKVLAPREIANMFMDVSGNELPAGATRETGNAHIIAAFNGPMAHMYVKDASAGIIAEIIRLMLQIEDSNGALQWLGLEELDYKQIRAAVAGRMKSSIDQILIRSSENYCIFDGLNDDGSTKCTETDPYSSGKYVEAWARISGMNHPYRSGDIVLIMKDATSDSALARYTTGVACKSWHGSLNPSDSYVPLIISYPSGNKTEAEKILQADFLCKSDYRNCRGNWNLFDIVKRIIAEEYE